MDYQTLNEVRDLLRSNLPSFLCIGRPDRVPCDEWLEKQCKRLALGMLTECNANLTRNSQWAILTLLLCPHCKVTYTQKTKIRKQWEAETPEIDPGGRKGRSPHSKYFKPSELDRRRSSGIRLAAPGDSPVSRGRSCEPSTPSSPTEAVVARRAARYDSANLPGTTIQTTSNDIMMVDPDINDLESTGAIETPESAPTRPPGRIPRVRVSGDGPFTAGESSTWAPWALRHEVLRLLEKPMPKLDSRGSIYAVEVMNTPYVKIGITTRDVRARLMEIQERHGQALRIGGVKFEDDIPILQLYRLEKLVHADLAFFQQNLTVQKAAQRRTHREYFEVDLATAMKTIRMWLEIMQNVGLDAGTEIDQHIKIAVRDSIREIDASPAGANLMDIPTWNTINADHELRHNFWSVVFGLGDGGIRKRRVNRTVSSLIVVALTLCFIYSSNLPDWVKNISTFLLWTAGVLYTMGTGPSDGCITWIINTPKTTSHFIASLTSFARPTL